MNIQAPFGFVTGCHTGDLVLASATLATMSYYCPDIPICLVVDGSVDVSGLIETYKVQPLFVSDLKCRKMRELVQGNPRAKLAAMWEGPFEHYVWLDSDAIVWGDIRPLVTTKADFQVFSEKIHGRQQQDESEMDAFSHFYFDPRRIGSFAGDFDWEIGTYFCTGVFGARRNAIPFDLWMEVEHFRKIDPKAISLNDQGTLNVLVNLLNQRSKLSVVFQGFQQIPHEHGLGTLADDLAGCGLQLPRQIDDPRFVHFCGVKPYLQYGFTRHRAHLLARLQHHRMSGNSLSAFRIIQEESKLFLNRIRKKLLKESKLATY